jgi:hypothetical protein
LTDPAVQVKIDTVKKEYSLVNYAAVAVELARNPALFDPWLKGSLYGAAALAHVDAAGEEKDESKKTAHLKKATEYLDKALKLAPPKHPSREKWEKELERIPKE